MSDTTPLILRAAVAHTKRGGAMPARSAMIERAGVQYVVLWDASDAVVGVYRVRKTDGRLVRLKRTRGF